MVADCPPLAVPPAHSQALLDACASVRRDFTLEATLPHFRLVNFQILQVGTALVLHWYYAATGAGALLWGGCVAAVGLARGQAGAAAVLQL